MAKLSPIVSEFETTEQAEEYDVWFGAKVQEAMDSKRPRIPHDEAMARVKASIERAKRAAGRLEF